MFQFILIKLMCNPNKYIVKARLFTILNRLSNHLVGSAWVAQWVKSLPSAQVMIVGSWDGVPPQVPHSVGILFLCPHSFVCTFLLTRSQINTMFQSSGGVGGGRLAGHLTPEIQKSFLEL